LGYKTEKHVIVGGLDEAYCVLLAMKSCGYTNVKVFARNFNEYKQIMGK